MRVRRLAVAEFRNIAFAEMELPLEGVTLVRGANGQGKTNVLEALGMLANRESFRGAEVREMIRTPAAPPPDGGGSARIQGTLCAAGNPDHSVVLDIELTPQGRTRARRNGKSLSRTSGAAGEIAAVSFTPDDLGLVKGGPGGRRKFLDDGVGALSPVGARERALFEKALRQRARLLKQAGGRLSPDIAATMDVWDAALALHGEMVASAREALVSSLGDPVAELYSELSGQAHRARLQYRRSWEGPLLDALGSTREEDVRSGFTRCGPQRDELVVTLNGAPARSIASQGEQRCLALGLRLAEHRVVRTGDGDAPVLLLDDIFSELDPRRSAVLVANIPAGQVLVSAASPVPPGLPVESILDVEAGRVSQGDERMER